MDATCEESFPELGESDTDGVIPFPVCVPVCRVATGRWTRTGRRVHVAEDATDEDAAVRRGVDIGFSFSASASKELFRVISIEAELPPIGGEEGCHACPMVGFAPPVHPDQGEDILRERPDGLQSQAMLDQGEGTRPKRNSC